MKRDGTPDIYDQKLLFAIGSRMFFARRYQEETRCYELTEKGYLTKTMELYSQRNESAEFRSAYRLSDKGRQFLAALR